jgi:hypothetical protein
MIGEDENNFPFVITNTLNINSMWIRNGNPFWYTFYRFIPVIWDKKV